MIVWCVTTYAGAMEDDFPDAYFPTRGEARAFARQTLLDGAERNEERDPDIDKDDYGSADEGDYCRIEKLRIVPIQGRALVVLLLNHRNFVAARGSTEFWTLRIRKGRLVPVLESQDPSKVRAERVRQSAVESNAFAESPEVQAAVRESEERYRTKGRTA